MVVFAPGQRVGKLVSVINSGLRKVINVYADRAEPMRWAGVTMCSVFLLGLIALPFAPETQGEPLPE